MAFATCAGCTDSMLSQLQRAAPPQAATPASKTESLIAILSDVSLSDASRIRADKQLLREGKSKARTRLVVLEQILYEAGNHPAVREYAMDALAATSKARAGRALAMYLPQFHNWQVLRHACALAGRLKDPRLIQPLVQSLDRPAKTVRLAARPEAVVLPEISGRPLTPTLVGVLRHGHDPAARIAALDVLRKLRGAVAVAAIIRSSRHGGTMLSDLRWWVRLFHQVPRGKSEMLWIDFLRQPKLARMVRRAARDAALLDKQPDFVMAPRFVNVLACTHRRTLLRSRQALLDRLTSRLSRLRHLRRPIPYPHAPTDIKPTLTANLAKLSRCDLLTLRALLRGLAQARFRRHIYRYGMQDMSNTQTEFGGLLSLRRTGNRWCTLHARLFAPLSTGNDGMYVTSDQLLLATANGLSQFILHFQKIRNARFVGPAAPDLAYVKHTRCNDVVFTSVAPNRFDATFYTPRGAVIDLGVYSSH